VSKYVDLPFKCAHNMKHEHTIDGKIFQFANKALHQCEFVKVKTIGDGNCGFDAVIKAVTSDQKYHGLVIGRELPTSIVSLRYRLAEELIKTNIHQREVVQKSWSDISASSEKEDVIGRYKKMAWALGALDDEEESTQQSAKELLTSNLLSDDVYLDEGLARVVEKLYDLKLLVVLNFEHGNFEHGNTTLIPGWDTIVQNEKCKHADDLEKVRKFWPYVAYVNEGKLNASHYVLLSNSNNEHFEVFYSNFYKKAVFTKTEMQESPTVSVLFRQELKDDNWNWGRAKKRKGVLDAEDSDNIDNGKDNI